MKSVRSVLIATMLLLTVFSAVLYTACHKDHCTNVKCLNKGVCDNGNCICLTGYEGPRCDTLSRNKFVGTFNGHDICHPLTDTFHQYHIQFITVKNKPLELTMKNLLNNVDDSATCTIMATDSFVFQGFNNSTTFTGYGTLRRDTLRMVYHVQHDTTNYDCKYFGGSLW